MRAPRLALLPAVALAALTACTATYPIKGVEPTGPDRPGVQVTARVEDIYFPQVGNIFRAVDYRPEPSLSASFRRVLEKYVARGAFVIESAKVSTSSNRYPLTTRLSLVVSTEGRLYTLQTDRDYGLVNYFGQDLPYFLDGCARQLAAQLNPPGAARGPLADRPPR